MIAAGDDGLGMPELQSAVGKDVCKIGMGNCLKNKWAKKDKASGKLIAAMTELPADEVKDQLILLKSASSEEENAKSLNDKAAAALKRRKLITLITRKSYTISRGASYAPQRVKKAADLTKEMLESESGRIQPSRSITSKR